MDPAVTSQKCTSAGHYMGCYRQFRYSLLHLTWQVGQPVKQWWVSHLVETQDKIPVFVYIFFIHILWNTGYIEFLTFNWQVQHPKSCNGATVFFKFTYFFFLLCCSFNSIDGIVTDSFKVTLPCDQWCLKFCLITCFFLLYFAKCEIPHMLPVLSWCQVAFKPRPLLDIFTNLVRFLSSLPTGMDKECAPSLVIRGRTTSSLVKSSVSLTYSQISLPLTSATRCLPLTTTYT